jgi:hypothetical protein
MKLTSDFDLMIEIEKLFSIDLKLEGRIKLIIMNTKLYLIISEQIVMLTIFDRKIEL